MSEQAHDPEDDVFRVGNLFISRKALQSIRDSLVPLEKRSQRVSDKIITPSVSSQGRRLRQTSFQISSMVSQARRRQLVEEFKTQAADKRNLQQTLQAMSPHVVVSSEPDRALQNAALQRMLTSSQRTRRRTHRSPSPSRGSEVTLSNSKPRESSVDSVRSYGSIEEKRAEDISAEDSTEEPEVVELQRIYTLCPPDADLDLQAFKQRRQKRQLRAALTVQVGAPQIFSLLQAGMQPKTSLTPIGSNTASGAATMPTSAGLDDNYSQWYAQSDQRSRKREVVLCIIPRVGTAHFDPVGLTLEHARMAIGGTPGLTAVKEAHWLPYLRRAYVVCDWDSMLGHSLASAGGVWTGLGSNGVSTGGGGTGSEDAAAAVRAFLAQSSSTAHSPFVRIGSVATALNYQTPLEKSFEQQQRALVWFQQCSVQGSSRQQMGRAIVSEERARRYRESTEFVHTTFTPNLSPRPACESKSSKAPTKASSTQAAPNTSRSGLTLVLK